MKLIARLRESQPAEHTYPHVNLVAVERSTPGTHDDDELALDLPDEEELALFDDDEHLGVGAAMPQDVEGLEFLDSYRRKNSELHEDFPPHGLAWADVSVEVEY